MLREEKHLFKSIICLAVPIIIENIFQTLLGTMDTYFAGKINDNAIAAIGVTSLIMNLYISFFTAVSIGASTVISRYVGTNDWKKVKRAALQSILLGSILGILIGIFSLIFCKPILKIAGTNQEILNYAVPYFLIISVPAIFLCLSQILASCLRAVKDSKTPMYITGVSNVINIVLNILFIKLGFGVVGLALATTISRGLVALLLLFKVERRILGSNIQLRMLTIEWSLLKPICQIGIPAGLEKLIMRIGQIVYNGMILSLGTASYVAHNIGGTIESYSYIGAFGFGMATATLVGICLGQKNPQTAKKITFMANGITTCIMTLIGIVFYRFAPQLAALFTDTVEIQDKVASILQLIAFFQPFASLSQIMSSALQGAGDTRFPMYTTLLGIWIIRVGVGYFLAVPCHLGLLGVWCGYAIDLTIRGILLLIRFIKGKWTKIMILDTEN